MQELFGYQYDKEDLTVNTSQNSFNDYQSQSENYSKPKKGVKI